VTAGLVAKGLRLPGRLEETDLELRAGELACLVGPNGSGKTSLLHALAGIGRPGGSVRIDGEDPRRTGPERRRLLLSYLPASRDIAWPLSVRDLVGLDLPAGDSAPVLEQLGLTGWADRRVDRLSTGERSRVLIARALAAGPRLLLLDEPVANLDPLWQLRLMAHLRDLAHRDRRLLLVAMHDLDLAGLYADRLIIMRDGLIAADGKPHELLVGPMIPEVFGIERQDERWRPVDQRP
jgi:iron complex transport system ATP-binding protein